MDCQRDARHRARWWEKNPVVLFMKGTRSSPQCGFSARVVEILDGLLPDYLTVDVLADPALREGIKEFSSLADDPAALRARASSSAAPTSWRRFTSRGARGEARRAGRSTERRRSR